MNSRLSRRSFLRSSATLAGASAIPAVALTAPVLDAPAHETGKLSPLKLGICSYTFRNFTREQMIGFLKQLHMDELNVKDVKDHLPADQDAETTAIAPYQAAGIKLHAAGHHYFGTDDDAAIRPQ